MNKLLSKSTNTSLRKTIIDAIAIVSLVEQKKLSSKTSVEIEASIKDVGRIIEKNLEKSSTMFGEVYSVLNSERGMDKWRDILSFLQEPKDGLIPAFIIKEMYENTAFFADLMIHAYEAFQQAQWRKAQMLYFFIASLYPFYLKPYIFLAVLEEKIHGVASAMVVYEALLPSFKDPELYFCAAECFWRNGKPGEVVPLLIQARDCLQELKTLSQEEQVLQKNILGLLEALK